MKQADFLEQHVFTGLTNLNSASNNEENQHFSEEDFAVILERAEHFGMSIYEIEAHLDGKQFGVTGHNQLKKKATDANWYKKAFLTFSKSQSGLNFSAKYKVSTKLLDRLASNGNKVFKKVTE